MTSLPPHLNDRLFDTEHRRLLTQNSDPGSREQYSAVIGHFQDINSIDPHKASEFLSKLSHLAEDFFRSLDSRIHGSNR